MDAKMSKTKIGCCHKIFDSAFTREESVEAVVPDIFPDIAAIVDASGTVCLRGKEARQGEMSVTAAVNSTILYMPEGESRARRLEVSIPFSITGDAPEVNDSCDLVCRLRLCAIDVRSLNPRKVLVRAEIAVELEAYCGGELELSGAPEDFDGHRVSVKESELSFTSIVSVREKTFVLNDEYSLPASLPPMHEILSKRVEISCDDVKPVANKLVFKGAALVSVLYSTAGEDEGATQAASFTTEFSQIIEMDAPMENVSARVSPMLTGVYVEQSGGSGGLISAELHVVAQVTGAENAEMRYVEDAYCNEHPVALSRDSVSLLKLEREINLRETLREDIETAGKARELIEAYAMPGAVTAEGGTMSCDVRVRLIYKDSEGELRGHTAKFTVTGSAEIGSGMYLSDCAAVCPEAYAALSAGGIELRLTVDFSASLMREILVEPVCALTLDEETQISIYDRPSITVLTADAKHSVWSLAKKYCSTPELVLSANGLSEDDYILGRLLLIPRSR